MRSTVGPVEGAIDTLNEGLSVERLREKADGPARERPLPDSRILKSGNKDDRRTTMCGRQSDLQLETADARHDDIEQNQLRQGFDGERYGLQAVRRGDDVEPLAFKDNRQKLIILNIITP